MTTAPTFTPIADHALLVEFATEIGDAANASVARLDRTLAHTPPDGVVEVVPAFVNLLIDFDPTVTDHAAVETAVRNVLADERGAETEPREHVVHVCYDAAFGPDLVAVADRTGSPVEAVIEAHLSGDYRVVMYGFAPGYAYMAGVPRAIQVPRKPAPVRGVPAGSVIVAGPQCLVTTIEMPTGWSVIGRSPTRVLRPDAERPFLFDPGDRVRFERIDLATYERLAVG